MAKFMDVHSMEGGVSASDVAKAHQADVETQDKYGVKYERYWVDEQAGKIFCLVDAPDAETANTVHREAHGLSHRPGWSDPVCAARNAEPARSAGIVQESVSTTCCGAELSARRESSNSPSAG